MSDCPFCQPKENWEKEFEDLYHKGIPMGGGIDMENPYLKYGQDQIKSFIRNLLQKERQKWVEEIEEAIKEEIKIHKGWLTTDQKEYATGGIETCEVILENLKQHLKQ